MINLTGKTYLITGVANKKSVATFTAKTLIEAGANCIFTVQNDKNYESTKKLFPNSPIILLDVENENHITLLKEEILKHTNCLSGFLHSMAYANFSEGPKPFHQTLKKDFLQACHISSFSLVEITNEIKDILTKDASIVTISISNTKATSYGYLGPIKSMLETTVCYLAKSLSLDSQIRVNSIGAGPLKTSASAGIPNYIENYLYSSALTLRKDALKTQEVANMALFLLSPLSSGVNAENLVVDLGMNSNYFDQEIVKQYAKDL